MQTLDEFNRQFLAGGPVSDGVFDEFLANFTHMGVIDRLCSWLSVSRKSEILNSVALGHIASTEAGRDYLKSKDKDAICRAEDGAVDVLKLLMHDDRKRMLTRAEIGQRGQIYLKFLDMDLCLPLGHKCFENTQGRLTHEEIEQLLSVETEGAASGLAQFAERFREEHVWQLDREACLAWSAAIDRWIGKRRIAELGVPGTVIEALGSSLRALGRRVPEFDDATGFSLHDMLSNCAEAFHFVGDRRAYGLALMELGALHVRTGNANVGVSAYRRAADELGREALDLKRVRSDSDADACREDAFACFAKLGESGAPRASISTSVHNENSEPRPPGRDDGLLGRAEFDWLWAKASERAASSQTF
ncbi:hypothetical protein [Pandoraea commovens]|uniref:hypothetical protein n=1 Tax=Pandoraea commovens TaxID=2508289 RepID=UPI00123F4DD0|nr:hypothetical protein [Pandoraea commovens]